MPRRYADLGPSGVRTRIPSVRRLIVRPIIVVASQNFTLPCAITTSYPVSRCLSLLLAMSSHFYLFFPPRGHEPPPTLRDRLNLHLSLQRRRHFPTLHYDKRSDVAPCAIGSLFLLPTPSSPYCTRKVSEYDSLWQPPAAHSDERPHPQNKSSRAQRCLKIMLSHRVISRAQLYEVIRWSGLLRCAPIIRSKTRWCTVRSLTYVVFLAKSPRTVSIQEGLDCLGLYKSGLEGDRYFRLVVELTS